MENTTKRSNAWFLLPLFLNIVGGVIAFFMLRESDPAKAKNCLYLGAALLAVAIVMNIAVFATSPDIFIAESDI